jgi:hypothetical protein
MNNTLLSYRFIPAIGLSAVIIGREIGENSMIPDPLSWVPGYRNENGTSSCGFKTTYNPT